MPLTESDRDALIALITNEEIGRTYMVPDLASMEKRDAVFARFLELSNDPERFVCGIFEGGRLIGMIHEVGVSGREMELGYFIDPAKKGRGFASEALKAAIAFLFASGFEKVTAGAFSGNAASLRVMEKAGMKRTGATETLTYRGAERVCIMCEIRNDKNGGGPI